MTQPTLVPAERPTAIASRTVAVLYGGTSSERDVSLESGRAVLDALSTPADAADRRGPRRVIGVEIGATGCWHVGDRALAVEAALARLADVDVYFLGLHGGEGEGGVVQGLLRSVGKAFTGSDVGASAAALDKVVARSVVEPRGVTLPPAELVDRGTWNEQRAELLERLGAWETKGWFVKPRLGGSSLGIRRVESRDDLPAAIAAVLALGDEALVERCAAGVEATCAVLGDRGEELRALTPVEIQPNPGRYFDYDEKYSPTGAAELCPPEHIGRRSCERLQELALRAHRALGCDGYSRSDFIVPCLPSGESGEPVFLETNTLPGLTPRSLLPLAAGEDGIDFRSLCLRIAEAALRRSRRAR